MITVFELLLIDVHVLVRTILVALIAVPLSLSFPLPTLLFEIGDLPVDAQCVWSHESSISSSYFPLELRRAISHESGLRKLHCSRLLRASCSLQAAARKCSVQVALRKCSEQVALRKCSAPVAPRKRFAHVLCASWSVQVALRLLCASCSAQVL